MWLTMTLLGAGGFAASGLIGMVGNRRRNWGHWLSVLVAVLAALCGLTAAMAILLGAPVESLAGPGPAPVMTTNLRLDPLAAFFLVPIFLIGGLCSLYGIGYWKQSHHPRTGRKLRFWYGILISSMAMITLSNNGICFLFAWELMAISTFFLIATEDFKPDSRQAAWVYLAAAHISTLLLFAFFALLRMASGSFLLRPLSPEQAGMGLQTALFLLALGAFGVKAGMVPLHFWLPEAHANAPSHVSATLSGTTIKMGIFGLLRVLPLLPARPLGWGILVMTLGALSAFLGVLWAIGQHDLKKLLAYHSVENIGIILLGLGLALIGEAKHQPIWIILGMAGCLLHVWNHGLFKSLLFLSAGSVIHAAGTRKIDRLGGLAQSMPLTSNLFLLGAIAICGLPPLNGFVSELFIYVGLLRTMTVLPILALAAGVLAMVGALAAACFTKVCGAVFLGTARTKLRRVREAGPAFWLPMMILAGGCLLIGMAPTLVATPLNRTTSAWAHRGLPALVALTPLTALTIMNLSLAAVLLVAFLLRRFLARQARTQPTWNCGYAGSSSRMQYTASSLAQMLLGTLRPLLRMRRREPRLSGLFAGPGQFHSHVDDPVLKNVLEPGWRRLRSVLANGRVFQRGNVQSYLFYMLLMLLFLLLITLPLGALWKILF
jgi:hydrogenase-4 component B